MLALVALNLEVGRHVAVGHRLEPHQRRRCLLRIIAPFWVGPCCGVMKMSSPSGPGCGILLGDLHRCRRQVGREWNVSSSPGTRPAGGSGVAGIDPDGVATVKWNVPAPRRGCAARSDRDHLTGHERLGRQEASAVAVGVRFEPARVDAAAGAGHDHACRTWRSAGRGTRSASAARPRGRPGSGTR